MSDDESHRHQDRAGSLTYPMECLALLKDGLVVIKVEVSYSRAGRGFKVYLVDIDRDGTPKDDVKLPGCELGKQIRRDFGTGKVLLVTTLSALGEEQASGAIWAKEAPESSS
ncbi:eukaryotic translation initiation factor 5A [Mycena maculata]|uniref:Eukaryotic translation initiation factor 5A n=1 Tax=Mycena maculata TaxID=230809 RepID=A0AAD7MJT8_9AGAR|nr:eukaryotic translation initiation factor 5A [Mycena maculata]